jgi:phosphoribosylformylglycinamidine synthase
MGFVRSCHDLSEGGLAAAAAEMAFAGGLGVSLNLKQVPTDQPSLSDAARLFSESKTRFLLEVTPETAAAFERCLNGIPFALLGEVKSEPHVTIIGMNGSAIISESIQALKESWQAPLRSV